MISVLKMQVRNKDFSGGIKYRCTVKSVVFRTAALAKIEHPDDLRSDSLHIYKHLSILCLWNELPQLFPLFFFVATPSSVSQTNNDPRRAFAVESLYVKVPHKGRDVWQDQSHVEEDVSAADSSPAAGGWSWHSPCTHWQAERLWGGTPANCCKVSVPLSSF